MKKLSILILIAGIFFYFLSSTKSYANHAPHDVEMAVKFGSDNGNTEWEVAYRYQFSTEDARGNYNGIGYTATWQRWVDQTSNRYVPVVNHTFDRVSYLNVASSNADGMGPRWGANSNHHPTYKIQWGTTCYDPKEQSVWDTQNISPTYRIYLFVPDVTSPLPGANNSGRRVSYAYGNAISSRTDLCPFLHDIKGRIFVDHNRDGNQDSGEPDYNTGNSAIEKWGDSYENTGSDSNGNYRFYNLPERSDYGIRLNVPNGYTCTSNNNCRVGCQSQGCGSSGFNLPPDRTFNFGIAPRDLDITSFTYPGGVDTGTSDVTLVIRNNGDVPITQNFDVTVRNGDGRSRTVRVTQTLSPNERLNLSGSFTNMPRPNAGRYTATAIVDSARPDEVTESNENNNDATDNYTTTRPMPDLIVVDSGTNSFNYPGGDQNGLADPTVVIRNTGNATARAPFNVRVDNNIGNGGNTRTRPVTQDIAAGDSLDVSSLFAGMPRPPARANPYTARATVDFNDDVNESDENNNTADDNYRSTNIPTADLAISSFVYPSGQVGTTVNPTLTITNRGTATINTPFVVSIVNRAGGTPRNYTVNSELPIPPSGSVPLSGRFTGMPLPATEGIGYTAIATADVNGVIDDTNPNNNTATSTYNASGIPVPVTYSIQGGVFLDNGAGSNAGNGIKDPGENYLGQQVTISGPTYRSPNTAGFTEIGLGQGDYTLTYTVPPGFEATYPPSNGALPPSVGIHVENGGACDVSNHRYATCLADGSVAGMDFGIQLAPVEKWFQGVGGDMRTDPSFHMSIPITASGGPYFSLKGAFQTPGVVFYGSDFGLGDHGQASQKGWLVNKAYTSTKNEMSYFQMDSVIAKNGKSNDKIELFSDSHPICDSTTGNCTNSLVSVPSGIYNASKTMNITGGDYHFVLGRQYIIFISGNLNINSNIYVPKGSTVMFIVNGDIKVASNVTEIDGIYSANGSFTVPKVSGGADDTPLTIQGSVVTNGGNFNNQRDLGSGNSTTPAVQIIYRPDFVLNAPSYIRTSNFSFQEVAPGN